MKPPRLLITRPDDEAERTAGAARAAGFEPVYAPLLIVEPLAFALPAQQPDSLLFTSPRAPAALAGIGAAWKALPCYTVGPATTAAALRAGFHPAGEGAGDGNAALAMAAAAGHRRFLHPHGEDHIGLHVPAGVQLIGMPVYKARAAVALSRQVVRQLASGGIFATLLLSPRVAQTFAGLVRQAAISRAGLRLVAISPNAAAAAGPGWLAVEVAGAPRLDAAFAAAQRLWQGKGHV